MNMEARFMFVLAVFTQWKVIRTVSNLGDFEGITFRHKMFFSGKITDDVTFLHKTFLVPAINEGDNRGQGACTK